jgi:hypothetical protein
MMELTFHKTIRPHQFTEKMHTVFNLPHPFKYYRDLPPDDAIVLKYHYTVNYNLTDGLCDHCILDFFKKYKGTCNIEEVNDALFQIEAASKFLKALKKACYQ